MKQTGAQLQLWSSVRRWIVAAASIAMLAVFGVSLPILITDEQAGPRIAAAEVLAAETEALDAPAPLILSALPRIEIVSGGFKLLPSEGAKKGSQAQADLAKQITSGNALLEIDGATVRINLSSRPGGESAPVRGGTSGPAGGMAGLVGDAVRALKYQSIRLRNTKLIVASEGAAPVDLFIETADVVRSRDTHAVKGKAHFRGRAVDFSITTQALTQLEGGVAALPIKAVVSNHLASTSLTGHVTFGTEAKLVSDSMDFRVLDVPAFAQWTGLSLPHKKSIGSFRAEGDLEWAGSGVAFSNASFLMDGNAATGSLTVGFRKARTFVEGTLAFERLDVSRYQESFVPPTALPPAAGPSADGDGTNDAQAETPSTTFLRQLREVDADLRISAETFKAGTFTANGLAATIALNDGRLMADVAEIQLPSGGEGVVQITIDAAPERPESRLFAKLENFDIATVGRVLFGEPVVSGPGRVVARLVGRPESYDDYLRDMVGVIEIESEGGATAKIDIAKVVASGQAPGADNRADGIAVDPVLLKGATRLDWLMAVLRVGQGRILADHVIASSGGTAIEARGSTHVKDRRVTVDLWLGRGNPKSTLATAIAAAGIGPAQASPHGLTGAITEGNWVRIEGDWERPVVRSEPIVPITLPEAGGGGQGSGEPRPQAATPSAP